MEDNELNDTFEKANNSIHLEDVPWIEPAWDNVQSILRKGFLSWCTLVCEIGVDESVDAWTMKYTEEVKFLTERLETEMLANKNNTIHKIEELLCKLQNYCKKLRIKMPKIGNEKKSLIDHWTELKEKINELDAEIKQRETQVDRLRKRQQDLCASLGKTPQMLARNPLPTANEILKFEKDLEELEEENFKRQEEFFVTKEKIITVAKEFNYKAQTDFEMLILNGDDEEFCLSTNNMLKLRELHAKLCDRLESLKQEVADLRLKIETIWDMLDTDLIERETFKGKTIGYTLDVLEALKAELRRCEELKKANIKNFIEKLRDSLRTLWSQCHRMEDYEIREFPPFTNDYYNEDLLELHDIEVRRWENYYNENCELLKLIEKHEQSWSKMLHFEEKATSKDRFHNRGGKLLQEERERNKLCKSIPKLEEDIIRLAGQYEKIHNGDIFTTYGRNVEDYIDVLHCDRENIKKQKLSARKQQRDVTVTPMKSVCSLFPPNSANKNNVTSATKRKILGTPNNISSVKKLKVATPSQSASKRKLPKLIVSRASTERKNRQLKMKQRRSIDASKLAPPINNVNVSVITEYDDFQKNLTGGRSTNLPEEMQIIAGKSTVNLTTKTPLKTPRKSPRAPLSACKSNIKLLF